MKKIPATYCIDLIAPYIICEVVVSSVMIEKGVIKSFEEYKSLSAETKQAFKEENKEMLVKKLEEVVQGYNDFIKKENEERKAKKKKKS